MAQTPLDFLNSLPVETRRELAGKFTNQLPQGLYANLSFSNVAAEDCVALGAQDYEEWFFEDNLLLTNMGTGILRDFLWLGQQVPQCQATELNAINQRIQELEKHCTFSFKNSEMTRRALVDAVVAYSVKVADSSYGSLVVFGEEYSYDTSKVNGDSRGVAIEKGTLIKNKYVLTGPIDYVLVSVKKATALTNKGANAWNIQHLMNARINVCSIEVKAEFGGLTQLWNHGVCQAWAQAFTIGEAWAGQEYRPFVLTDGDIWVFSVFRKGTAVKKWFHTMIRWNKDVNKLKLIVSTLVCWMSFPSSRLWQCIEAKRVQGNNANFTQKHTFA